MKKIFTLITMLVGVMTGTQAAVTPLETATITETTLIYTSPANLQALGYAQDGKGTQTYSAPSDRGKGMDPTDETSNAYAIGTTATVLKGAGSNKEVLMYVTNVTQVDAYVKNNGGDGRPLTITATPSSGTAVSVTATTEQGLKGFSGRISLELDATESYTISFTSPSGDLTLYAVRLIAQAADAPAINAAGAEIMATESGVAATQEIEISGVNLTGSTLTAELSPAVEGLSVELASTAITAGSIETTATISYTSTVNVDEGTTTLVLSDGTTTKEVTITYSAFVAAYEQESISEATTWDFTKDVTGHVQYANDNREERLYANIPELEYASTFNAKALTFEGEYPERESKYAQNGTLRFNTTVPGTVEVTFSNTGGNNNDRYLEVNGVRGEVEAVGTTQNTETFSVGAGDVVITNVAGTEGGTVALRYYKVVFTPVEVVELTIGSAGAASFSCTSALDFTNSDVYAYIITGRDGTNFTKERVYQVPANTGVIVAASEAGTYLVPVAAEEPAALEGNLLEATSTGEYTVTAEDYGTVYGLFQSAKTGKVGFQKKKEGYTFGANKSYLRMPAGTSANEIFFDFDVTNAISNVAVETEAANNNDTYNLNGQKVNSSFRGVVIRGGKKLIQK